MNHPNDPSPAGDPAAGRPFDPMDAVRAIRGALPTSRHAGMLFDMVAGGLGGDAVLETVAGRTVRTLYRVETSGSDPLVPWPALRLGTKGRLGVVVPIVGPAEVPPRPGKPPALRNLGPAEIEIHDGPQRITVTYGDDGRWFETSRSASVDAFAGVVAALSKTSAHAVDLLAEYVEGIDLGRCGPGRVLYPVPLPGGVASVWNPGLWAIREALFEGRLPEASGWAVADGFVGRALAWGASREEALEAWRAEVRRVRPEPAKSEPLPDSEKDGIEPFDAGPHGIGFTARIRGPKADVEWPEPTLENTPAVVIPLASGSSAPNSWGSWVRLLGRHGTTLPALVRQDPGGFTLVGHALADAVDLDAIDERLDAVPETHMPPPPPGYERPDYDCRTTTYRLVDDHTREPVPAARVQSHWGWGFRARDLDGDELAWRVLRQRWHGAR